MDFDADGIPELLRDHDSWICWAVEERDGDLTKVPRHPGDVFGARCDPTDPEDWASFTQAVGTADETPEDFGIGYCFSPNNTVVGIDLDNCRDPETGEIDEWAADLVDRLDSWTQISTSGTGLHVFVLGVKPGEKCRTGDLPWTDDPDAEVEMYERDRFFAMTGWHLEVTPESIEQRPQELKAVYKELFVDDDTDGQQATLDAAADVDDEVVLERALENDDKLDHLFHSSGDAGYQSPSEADMALLSKLAFYAREDAHLMEQWARRSRRERDKWDESRGGQSWLEMQIGEAIKFNTDVYSPPSRDDGGTGNGDRPDAEAPAVAGTSSTDGVWGSIKNQFRFADDTDDKLKARYQAAAQATTSEDFITNEVSDHLHVYEPDEGIFVDRGQPALQELLMDTIGEYYSRTDRTEIEEQVKTRTFEHPDDLGGPAGAIAVGNGVLRLNRQGFEDEIVDHSPRFKFFSRIPVEFDPDAECPRFDAFLEEVIPNEEDRQTVVEYMGYCLMHWGLPFHKALFVVGPQASGKSTFLDVVRELLGEDAIASIAPQELVDQRFSAYQLWNAWANIRNDIDAKTVKNAGKFKEIVAGDRIYIENKNEEGFFIKPTAKHLYAANQLPDVTTDDDAFYRRILLVSFPHTVPRDQRDKNLLNKLKEERPGILNRAVEGLERLMEQGHFTGDMTPAETRETWESWGDSIAQFKADALEKVTDGVEAKKEVYNAYSAYCEEHGLPVLTQVKLTRELKKDKDIDDTKRTPDGYSKQVRCYTGFKLADEWRPDTDSDDEDDEDGEQSRLT